MLNRIRTEPVLVTALVQALIGLAVSFGLNLSGEQTAAIMTATAAVLAFVARSQVTPTPRTRNDDGAFSVVGAVYILAALVLLVVLLELVGHPVSVG